MDTIREIFPLALFGFGIWLLARGVRVLIAKELKIRIVKPPVGPAPSWVRDAWVGLELPVVRGGRCKTYPTAPTLNDSRTFFGGLSLWLRGKTNPMKGYPVYAGPAVDVLAVSKPKAADWWRENAPRLLGRWQMFVFNEEACSLITESSRDKPGHDVAL
jgi:hypothetical protein